MPRQKTVFVGISGGVDSAVSATLLKEAGYNVVGVFIKTWHPDFLPCNEEEERRDAMRVAAHLDIPFLTFDFEEEYKRGVADYMIAEYREGRTPNPDVMCNKEIKFGAFLKKAMSMGADYIATGHYAQSIKGHLVKSKDPSKDQVYFLWTLNQEQLSRLIFPIGHLKKEEVRKLAKKFKLPVADKKDSQGVCFLGNVDMKDFLKHYIVPKRGDVLLAPHEAGNEKGEVVGHHEGALLYTLGERHGFTITKKTPEDSRYYIIAKDTKNNTITVSQKVTLARRSESEGGNIRINQTNWINTTPIENKEYTAQVRYHGELLPCHIFCGSQASARVIFKKPVLVAPGQSVVFYDREIVLGGGVVV